MLRDTQTFFEDMNCDKQELNKVKSLVLLKRYLFVFYLELVTVIPQNIFFLEIRVKAQGGVFLPCKKPFLRLHFTPILVCYCSTYLFVIVIHTCCDLDDI